MFEALFKSIIHDPFDWVEVWATLFPILTWFWIKKNKHEVHPTIWYFIIAFFLNICIDVIWKLYYFLPENLRDNNVFYNVQSIIRVIIFLLYFNRILLGQFKKILVFAAVLYPIVIIGSLIVFYKSISFFNYNTITTTTESILLMLASILYLFQLLQLDVIVRFRRQPAFWISLGLIFFEATIFTINLTYSLLVNQNYSHELSIHWNRGDYLNFYNSYQQSLNDFAIKIWLIPNLAYLMFCLFITKAYYELQRK